MLPTQIFVGGPSEIGYHIQIKDLYKEFSLQQPNLMFRMGATIIERHINRIMEKYSFNITELREINQLTNRLVRIESDDIIGKYSTNIATKLDEMNTELSAVNQELGKRSAFRKQSIMKELTNIEKMYLKYIKSENKVLLSQLSKARAYLFPSDKPQERIFNIFQYLNKYSITLLNCMKDLLAKNDPGNHVVLKCWMF
ncbi:MAG: bacillithiol biosynthesis protein BshC [Candidatus Heimdallarchaeota archaeon]